MRAPTPLGVSGAEIAIALLPGQAGETRRRRMFSLEANLPRPL